MADYTRIPDDTLTPGQPGTQILFQLLRDNPLAVAGKRLLVFTSSGTLTVTDQMADVGLLAICIAGGGAGGTGGAATAGGGGGGGGFVMKEVQPDDLDSSDGKNQIAVTVGGAGGASSFGGFCSASAGASGRSTGMSALASASRSTSAKVLVPNCMTVRPQSHSRTP